MPPKPEALSLTLVAHEEHDREGTSPAVDVGSRGTLRLTLDIERTGWPSTAITIETSEDGNAPWRPLGVVRPSRNGEPTAIRGFLHTADISTWRVRECFPGADRFVRARWEFPWHDRAVFGIAGEAV